MAAMCDKERPLWNGAPVSDHEEVLHQVVHPLTTGFTAHALALMWLGRLLAADLAVMITTFFILYFINPNPLDHVQWAAICEGCIGEARIWYAVFCVVGAAAWLRFEPTLWRRSA